MRKKLFAILMSAMMMVTFMPAMAFAGAGDVAPTTVAWGSDFTTCTINGIPTTQITRTLVKCDLEPANTSDLSDWKGMIKAVATSPIEGVDDAIAYYYDLGLAKATEVSGNANALPASGNYVTATTFGQFFTAWKSAETVPVTEVTFSVPSYVKVSADAPKAVTADAIRCYVSGSASKNYAVKMATPVYNANKAYEVQSFAQPVMLIPDTTNGTVSNIGLAGTFAPYSINVQAGTVTPSAASYKVDGKIALSGDAATVYYDGAEHTLDLVPLTGVSATFKMLNKQTAQYEAVDAAKIQEVGTYYFEATAKMAGKTDVKKYITLTVEAAVVPHFGFVVNDAAGVASNKFHVAENYNVMDYIEVKPATVASSDANYKAKNKAYAAAVKANEKELMEFFNEYYDVTQKAKTFDATDVTAKIAKKDFATTAAENEVLAKYKALFAKFNVASIDLANDTAYFVLDKEVDIDWVNAPLTKKYHNKKGTLKKTYTFQVEAKASSKVTYKLQYGGSMIKIDKNTGKVTVKKGLKVGTYKVKVTASAGKNAADSYYMTIKMAKK